MSYVIDVLIRFEPNGEFHNAGLFVDGQPTLALLVVGHLDDERCVSICKRFLDLASACWNAPIASFRMVQVERDGTVRDLPSA